MENHFQFFAPAHLAILAAVPLLAAAFAVMQRRLPAGCPWVRLGLGSALLVDLALWYGYLAVLGQLFPQRLPLELCDVTLFLSAMALFTLRPAVFDLAYYWALAGTSMALLTPDVREPISSLSTIQFFVSHGLAVTAVLYLVWSGQVRPRRGSVARALVAVNILAAFDGAFDAIFKTDYMYLCVKPANASLLNLLGPWPWYIASSEVVALGLFVLLYLPFRKGAGRTA